MLGRMFGHTEKAFIYTDTLKLGKVRLLVTLGIDRKRVAIEEIHS